MVELVDTLDLKSNGHLSVRVQVPSRVQNGRLSNDSLPFLFSKPSNTLNSKKELFNPFTGWFFNAMGGSPINRGTNENKVTAIAEVFNTRERFRLAIAPEGTRKKVDRWRTGFYHIALQANIPILLVNFNYNIKKVSFLKLFYPTGNLKKDLSLMEGYFNKAMQV